jgi:hypothetical protein
MIGHNTGKIVGYGLRCKSCRICSWAKTKGQTPREHDCVVNFTGSSKAMEPDMACEIVHKIESGGDVTVGTLVMDEDCTTIARVRREVDHDIVKWSDFMHIKKHVTGSLYKMQREHRNILTSNVISYVTKCFAYAVLQNKGNVEQVKAALLNTVPHLFGEHG